MIKILLTISIILTFVCCQTNSDNKDQVKVDVKINKPPIKKFPNFYSGDSALTLGFKIEIDTVFAYSKNPDYDNFENITTRKYKDSILIYVRKILTESLYNGSCEQKADTIYLNYWIDTLDCVSMQAPFILAYKMKRTKYSQVKLKYIDNVNMPSFKHCEE